MRAGDVDEEDDLLGAFVAGLFPAALVAASPFFAGLGFGFGLGLGFRFGLALGLGLGLGLGFRLGLGLGLGLGFRLGLGLGLDCDDATVAGDGDAAAAAVDAAGPTAAAANFSIGRAAEVALAAGAAPSFFTPGPGDDCAPPPPPFFFVDGEVDGEAAGGLPGEAARAWDGRERRPLLRSLLTGQPYPRLGARRETCAGADVICLSMGPGC